MDNHVISILFNEQLEVFLSRFADAELFSLASLDRRIYCRVLTHRRCAQYLKSMVDHVFSTHDNAQRQHDVLNMYYRSRVTSKEITRCLKRKRAAE